MFDKYEGMPEQDVLMMTLDVLKMQSSIERIGDDILVCDSLDGDEMTELMNEELDVSKEMELLEKWYKKKK